LSANPHHLVRGLVACALGALCLLSAAAAFAQAAPDAFYLALLRDGKAEMLRGDALAARKSFRLACFGFLEHPELLTEGLVRLGLAESKLNDQEGFVATFSRLAEVEERFAAYAPAALSADERRAFEERAVEWVTPEVLRSLQGFAPLVARKTEVDFAKLSPRDRTRELEKRSAAEPTNSRWKVLLAADDAAGERWAKALGRLGGLPDGAESGTAGCVRGQALARLKRCDEALAPLATCVAVTSDAGLAEARLTCFLAVGEAEAARAFAAQIVRPAADAPAVRKAISRLPAAVAPKPLPVKSLPADAKTAPAEAKAAPTPPAAKPVSGEAPAVAGTAVAPPTTPAIAAAARAGGSPLTSEEERRLAEARGMLKTVENRDELRRGFTTFRPLADRLPARADLQLLAGELAYRGGLWATGAEYFRRTTPGGNGPTDPTLRFYYAVCLYEAGDLAGAAEVASTGLEKLQRPPFVERYLQKIRAGRP